MSSDYYSTFGTGTSSTTPITAATPIKVHSNTTGGTWTSGWTYGVWPHEKPLEMTDEERDIVQEAVAEQIALGLAKPARIVWPVWGGGTIFTTATTTTAATVTYKLDEVVSTADGLTFTATWEEE